MYPSKLGLSFIALGFFLYLISLQSRSGLLFLILGILFGCYVINIASAYHAAKYLGLVPPDAMTGTEGETIRGTWELTNPSNAAIGLTEVRTSAGDVLFRIGVVAAGETIHITPDLSLVRRGIYPFHSLALISSYPFGLVRCRRHLPIEGEFVVYPAPYDCPVPRAAGFEPMVGGKYTGKNRSPSGDRFSGVRPMQPSDPLKLIHWASSAKGLEIMVKEFDEELSGRVAILMDAEPNPAPVGNELLIDWAARATVSLMLAALDQGHQVEYTNLADLEHLSVPPFADGSVVMHQLARLQPRSGSLTPERLHSAITAMPRKAGLCLVLTSCPQEIADYLDGLLAAERRTLSLYLPNTIRHHPSLRYGTLHYYEAHGLASA